MMKRQLTMAAGLLAPVAIAAQGAVNFSNGTDSLVRFAMTDDVPAALQGSPAGSEGGPALASWHVALYWQSGGIWSQVGVPGTFNAGAGRFVAGTRGNQNAPPSIDTFKVVAWSGNAANFEAALASGDARVYVGTSVPFQLQTGGDVPAPALTSGFTGMTVAPVPEPSMLSLGLVGAMALLLRRRRIASEVPPLGQLHGRSFPRS